MYNLNKSKKIYTCEVETNGTIVASTCFNKYVTQYNISPKLKSSNQENKEFEKKRINVDALKSLYLPHKAYFKFVVSTEEDLLELFLITDKFPKMEVYLMPEGIDRRSIIRNSKKLIKVCLEHNYKFSPREHIMIWNKQKGV